MWNNSDIILSKEIDIIIPDEQMKRTQKLQRLANWPQIIHETKIKL